MDSMAYATPTIRTTAVSSQRYRRAWVMAKMRLPASARRHDRPQLQVREIDHGIYHGETQGVLPHQLRPKQLCQQHHRRKLAACINSIPNEHPAEIRAQRRTFALRHGEYALRFSTHGRQLIEWHLKVSVFIGRGEWPPCRESPPAREDPWLAPM